MRRPGGRPTLGRAPRLRRERSMPRFFFDVRENGTVSPDEEALEFPDLDAAEREAAVAASAIARDRLPNGRSREIVMEVRDGDRQHLLTVTVSLHVERGSPPEPAASS